MSLLNNAKILLGVTGSIAAYKSVELLRELTRQGAEVRVILTRHGSRFVAPLTFSTLSGHDVLLEPLDNNTLQTTEHIDQSLWADMLIVAPATANILGKAAVGIGDDFLSTTLLAFDRTVIWAPAMNHRMFRHPAVQQNMQVLKSRGHHLVEPTSGWLACGEVGEGRLADPLEIALAAVVEHHRHDGLAGKKVLITSGPTREAIDPVRYVTNRSSGTMGQALALAALAASADVTLVTGPVPQPDLPGVNYIRVESAAEMFEGVREQFADCDLLIGAAAVADAAPEYRNRKIKKDELSGGIRLVPTPDILQEMGKLKKPGQTLIGFALESDDPGPEARRKMAAKHLDMIVANRVETALETENTRITLLRAGEHTSETWSGSKQQVALDLIRRVSVLI